MGSVKPVSDTLSRIKFDSKVFEFITAQAIRNVNLSKYQCPTCHKSDWRTFSTIWSCQSCGQSYPCVNGIPKLYLENSVGEKDKELRDRLYNGFLGTYYQHVMPFMSLPVRPAKAYWKGWLTYVIVLFGILGVVTYLVSQLLSQNSASPTIALAVLALFVVGIGVFSFKHPYLLYLMLLAVPVKLSLLFNRFKPSKTFQEVHEGVLEDFLKREDKLQVLDISTGTCNSLYRHGWMKLNAEYTGIDLSETMLLQGQRFMSEKQVPVDFVLGDALKLPFESESFDIVLNYGAINGFTNPKLALEEMARVTRKGGLVLFLDEQLYERASGVERVYFKKVLSSHNVIDHCPVELIPSSLVNVTVHQVYHFYYICTCYKH